MINDFQRYTHKYIEDIQRTSEMNGLIKGRKEGREEGRREQTNEFLAALDKETRSGKTSFSLDDLYRMLRETSDEGN